MPVDLPRSPVTPTAAPESYRAKVTSTLCLGSLVYQPLPASGAVLRILRGKLFHQRGVRNVADMVATPRTATTASVNAAAASTPAACSSASTVCVELRAPSADSPALAKHSTDAEPQQRKGYMGGLCKTCLLDPLVLPIGDLPAPAAYPADNTVLARVCTPVYTLGAGVADSKVKRALDAAVSTQLLSRRAADLLQYLHDELCSVVCNESGALASTKKQVPFAGPINVCLAVQPVQLTYHNYTMPELLSKVLPIGESTAVVALSGFEQVGHIAHVNLSSANVPYAPVIGQVILDCNDTVDVVVNKVDAISSMFREFKMDIIAERPAAFLASGARASSSSSSEPALTKTEQQLVAQEEARNTPAEEARRNRMLTATVRQHGCYFRVPYNRVYWNSRLSYEHTRLVEAMQRGDALFDVMAGVGPFAVPAAKNGVRVFANDLNPVAAQYMAVNAELNRLPPSSMHVYNLDGRAFMNTVLFDHVMGLVAGEQTSGRRHVTMNLPAIAVEFLNVFQPLRPNNESAVAAAVEAAESSGEWAAAVNARWNSLPAGVDVTVIDKRVLFHVYCFSAAADLLADAVAQCERHLGYALPPENVEEVLMVRDVAPTKRMICVSFTLPEAFWTNLLGSNSSSSGTSSANPIDHQVVEPIAKTAKADFVR